MTNLQLLWTGQIALVRLCEVLNDMMRRYSCSDLFHQKTGGTHVSSPLFFWVLTIVPMPHSSFRTHVLFDVNDNAHTMIIVFHPNLNPCPVAFCFLVATDKRQIGPKKRRSIAKTV